MNLCWFVRTCGFFLRFSFFPQVFAVVARVLDWLTGTTGYSLSIETDTSLPIGPHPGTYSKFLFCL